MTSLNPSHIPLGFGAKDPQKSRGQAIHRPSPGSDSLHKLPAIPDLRFEQSYMLSIAPYVHWRDSSSSSTSASGMRSEKGKAVENAALVSAAEADVQAVEVVSIEWNRVIWITVRDQVISPLLQGTIWYVSWWLICLICLSMLTSCAGVLQGTTCDLSWLSSAPSSASHRLHHHIRSQRKVKELDG